MIFWRFILIACCTGINLCMKEKEIISVSVNETILAPGKKGLVIIRVKVSPGYHIQADKVTNESLIPVSLETIANSTFKIKKALFPPYKLFRLKGTEETLNVLDSTFFIRLPVKAVSGAKEGRYMVMAGIRYQACNDKICLFPRKIDFDIPIIIK
jgi:hypothetical protein